MVKIRKSQLMVKKFQVSIYSHNDYTSYISKPSKKIRKMINDIVFFLLKYLEDYKEFIYNY